MLVGRQWRDGEQRGEALGPRGGEGHQPEPDAGAADIREKQHRQHGVLAHGMLRPEVVEAEEDGGDDGGRDPVHGGVGQRARP